MGLGEFELIRQEMNHMGIICGDQGECPSLIRGGGGRELFWDFACQAVRFITHCKTMIL